MPIPRKVLATEMKREAARPHCEGAKPGCYLGAKRYCGKEKISHREDACKDIFDFCEVLSLFKNRCLIIGAFSLTRTVRIWTSHNGTQQRARIGLGFGGVWGSAP